MKNLLKSIFIAAFPAISLLILIQGSINFTNHGFTYSILGQTIIALTIITFFAGLFIVLQARTSKNLKVYSFFIFIGLLISIYGSISESNNLWGLSISIFLALCWILYITWYSVFEKRNTSILKVGNKLPNFELEDTNKNKIKNTSFKGNPSIYLFYRGNWCPLCMAQIKEIAAEYKALEDRGVNTILTSPQPHKHTKSLTKKYNLGFHFLTDTNNMVAKQLGIFVPNGIPAGFQVLGYNSDTVMPTVIITDSEGVIVFSDLTDNYRIRPEPETFLKIIDGIN